MGIEALTAALAAGILKAMAADGWTAVRKKIVRALDSNGEDQRSADIDRCRSAVQRGDTDTARAVLTSLLKEYAEEHGDASATFQGLLQTVSDNATAVTNNSVNTGDISNSVVAGPGATAAGTGGVAGSGNSRNAGRNYRETNKNKVNINHEGDKKSAGPLIVGVLIALVAAVVLVSFLVHKNKDKGDEVGGKSGGVGVTLADPGGSGGTSGATQGSEGALDGQPIKTCGQWLRLSSAEGETVARDIALRLHNTQAAQDPFLVQDVQYSCGGVETRLLAKVLAPNKTQ
ncbi:hypothetical protein [Streptomyces sp. LN325]|uniref:hypothetical protein n=1 Tax=Streptomyces sp. LN325 TaxID=3112976 RepID=UPI0037112B24